MQGSQNLPPTDSAKNNKNTRPPNNFLLKIPFFTKFPKARTSSEPRRVSEPWLGQADWSQECWGMARSKDLLLQMVAVNSGKKTTLFQVAEIFWWSELQRCPNETFTRNFGFQFDIEDRHLLVLLLFHLLLSSFSHCYYCQFRQVTRAEPQILSASTGDFSAYLSTKETPVAGASPDLWGLNGIYGRLLAWPSSHGKPLVGDDFIEFSAKNGPGKQYPRYTFPLKVGWNFVPKHPKSEIAQSRCFLSSLLIYYYRYSSKTNNIKFNAICNV